MKKYLLVFCLLIAFPGNAKGTPDPPVVQISPPPNSICSCWLETDHYGRETGVIICKCRSIKEKESN